MQMAPLLQCVYNRYCVVFSAQMAAYYRPMVWVMDDSCSQVRRAAMPALPIPYRDAVFKAGWMAALDHRL